jgi:predicted lipid carrier protein YhbT
MPEPSRRPRLPAPLSLPLRLAPQRLHGVAAARILNRVFARERTEGELDFLLGHRVRVELDDAATAFTVTLGPDGFRPADPARGDLVIGGSLYDYLLLLAAREDPDTLFFQRRLRMAGNAALGVHLKNFLAALDPSSLPLGRLVQPLLLRGLGLYERWA